MGYGIGMPYNNMIMVSLEAISLTLSWCGCSLGNYCLIWDNFDGLPALSLGLVVAEEGFCSPFFDLYPIICGGNDKRNFES